MRRFILYLSLLLVPARVLLADKIVLKNGDVLTGTIVKKDGGQLAFDSEVFGRVSIPWTAVASVESKDAVNVVLPGGDTVSGKLTTAGQALAVETPSGARTAPLAEIPAMRNAAEQLSWQRLQHPGLLQLWTGSFDVGLALARGNARTDTLTTGFQATRVTTKDKLIVRFSQIHGSARVKGETSTIANAVRGGWNYDRSLTPRLFATLANEYEYDQFQDLDLRAMAGAGLGYSVIKSDRTTFSVQAAGNYSRENFSTGLSRNAAEANFGDDLLMKFSAATSVTQAFRLFANLSEPGEYRFNFDLSAVTALNRWLAWHITGSDRFLSNPVFGRQRNDILLTTGLRLTFAK